MNRTTLNVKPVARKSIFIFMTVTLMKINVSVSAH